ncbi:hypothetical protein ACOSP7_024380 [Xanthoceras sorbifolium]
MFVICRRASIAWQSANKHLIFGTEQIRGILGQADYAEEVAKFLDPEGKENESHSEIITKKTNDESETDEHGEFVKNLKVLMRIHGLFFESRIKIGGGRDDRRLLDVICGEVLVGCVVFYRKEANWFTLIWAEALGAECRATFD